MGVYQASGRLGQRIMVNPKEEMVVVFTGSIEGINYHPHDELYTDYILESIIGPPRIIEESTSESSNQTTMTNHTGSSDGLIDMQLMMISSFACIGVLVIVLIFQIRRRHAVR